MHIKKTIKYDYSLYFKIKKFFPYCKINIIKIFLSLSYLTFFSIDPLLY